jgi:hypothetical membrane protein
MGSIILFLKQSYWVFGLLGCIVIALAIVGTALVYRGINGQRYSFMNHYISELGEVGVSRNAWLFNTGMVITGSLFIHFALGLGLTLGGLWGYLGGLAGLWAGISCLLVGIYPMNNLTPHSRAATSYFRGGLATIMFFSIAIFLQAHGHEVITRWANLSGITAVISYASFIVLSARQKPHDDQERGESEPIIKERPRIWIMPVIEWLVFFTTILWFLVMAMCA